MQRVVFALAVLLLAACGSGARTADPIPEAVLGPLESLDGRRTTADVSAAAAAAAEDGDERLAPYLVDLLRVEFDQARVDAVGEALEALTGIPASNVQVNDHVTFGTWLLDRSDVVPPDTYPEWKGRLYAELSPEFEALIGLLDPRTAAEIQWGGVPFDGIAPIDTPALVSVTGADYLAPTDVVFGTVIGGVSHAYPLRILDVHEMSNDIINGEPVVLANCTLCRSGLLYSRLAAGRELEFVTSGLLLDSNKLMVDVQTRSIWQQLTGAAIAGPLAGTQLEPRFLTTTTWSDWSTTHPDTLVLDLPRAEGPALAIGAVTYDEGDAYRLYYESDDLWFPAPSTTGGPPKVRILGVEHNNSTLAIEVDTLADHGILVVRIGGDTVTAVPTAGTGARTYLGDPGDVEIDTVTESALVLDDGRKLPRLRAVPAFWFAWSSIHPESERWP